MALVLKDRVKETSTTTGTGTVTLLGASAGFDTFAVIGNGNTTYYTIVSNIANEWEVGVGTYNSSTLSRDTVLASSNTGSLVNFTAGTKEVFVTYPASRAVVASDNPGAGGEVLTSGGPGVPPSWETRLGGFSDVATVAALRALNYTFQPADKVYLQNVGIYDWSSSSTDADDGVYVIKPDSVTGAGRWLLLPDTSHTTAIRVKNQTGQSISKGTVLMAVGTLGSSGVIKAAPMDGSDPNSYKFILGLAASAIADGGDGEAIAFGPIRGLNTSSFLDGDVLWVSNTTTGGLVNTEPSGLNMPVAFVVHSHATAGILMVRVTPINENHWVEVSFETVAQNLRASNATLTYDQNGNLTTITYANGIVKTLSYTNGNLTSVVLSGSTPTGVNLRKSLGYTNGNLTSVSYSLQ